MANQYIAFNEEPTRGSAFGSNYRFLPIIGDLSPDFEADDKPRVEFRGQDTGLGDITVIRRDVKWSMKIKCYWYPGVETGLLFKHLLGYQGTRSVVDTNAYKGILYPVLMPYGSGMPLSTYGLGIYANTDENGTTRSQYFGGGRVRDCKISCKGTDDVILEFSLEGAWVGPPDQTAIGSVSFPAANPFNSSDYRLYIGGTPVRTGTPPNYTDITIGTAVQAIPDSLDITITNGLKDKIVGNGIPGPSKTYRDGKFSAAVECPLDYEDPASGFSSADEFKTLFTGPRTNNLLITFDNGDLAGAATAKYTVTIDLPLVMLKNPKKAERDSEGKTPSIKLGYESLYGTTQQYPMAMVTVDKAANY